MIIYRHHLVPVDIIIGLILASVSYLLVRIQQCVRCLTQTLKVKLILLEHFKHTLVKPVTCPVQKNEKCLFMKQFVCECLCHTLHFVLALPTEEWSKVSTVSILHTYYLPEFKIAFSSDLRVVVFL